MTHLSGAGARPEPPPQGVTIFQRTATGLPTISPQTVPFVTPAGMVLRSGTGATPGGAQAPTSLPTLPAPGGLPAAPAVVANSPTADPIQPQATDEGGLTGFVRGIGQAISAGVRSGVEAVSGLAAEILDGLRSQVAGLLGEAQSLVTAALSIAQSAWSALVEMTTQLVDGLKHMLEGAINSASGAMMALAQAVMNLDVGSLRAAWNRITGLFAGVWQQLQVAGRVVLARIATLWTGLQDHLNGALTRVTAQSIQRAFSVVQAAGPRLLNLLADQVQSLLQPISAGVTALWPSRTIRAKS